MRCVVLLRSADAKAAHELACTWSLMTDQLSGTTRLHSLPSHQRAQLGLGVEHDTNRSTHNVVAPSGKDVTALLSGLVRSGLGAR